MSKRCLLLLSNILFLIGVYAQPLSRQEQLPPLLAYAIHANRFNALYPQEKIYLHFDNTAYFSGETMWFSANVVGATASDSAFSKVLYVELLSPTGVVLQQQKLKIEEGRCHGAFPLVDASVKEANDMRGVLGYPSGYYEVRAYTRSMLNFDAHGCFSRVFPIYETPEKEGDYDNPAMKQYLRKEEIRPEAKKAKAFNMEFFPEGGHLICGVENRIAFKATNKEGKGVSIDGITIGGEHIALSPQHLGMGYFIFTPREKKVKASILYNGKEYAFALPEAESYGYAIQAKQEAGDTLRITISTLFPDTTKLLGMTLMHAGKVEHIDTLSMYKATQNKVVPIIGLSTGTYQFALFDATGMVLATRMLFINNGVNSSPIAIRLNKAHYKPFEKIKMRIETRVDEEQYLSLAVRDAADYGTGYDEDIRTYMLLSSELKGYIEQPGYYFESDDEEHHNALDLLMMVQGWSRYNIEQMQQPISPDNLHYTEGSLVLEGRALHPRKDKPMVGVDVCIKLYSPDRKQVQESKATSDEHGYWGVNLQDFEGEWDLNIQTYQDDKPIVARLRLERSSAPEVLAYPLAALPLQHRIDTTEVAFDGSIEEVHKLPASSILLENVDIEGLRRYVDFCTFQAYDVAKDKELIIDKGEYTNTVADYLIGKGYAISLSDGESFEQFLDAKRREQEGLTLQAASSTSGNPNSRKMDVKIKDDRSQYLEWLMEKSTINNYRTLWYVKDGTRNTTSPSSLPGFDIDIMDVKSIIVYDSPHSYMSNENVFRDFGEELITAVQRPKPPFPSGLYIVEIHLYPGRKSNISWLKNTRQTTFDGYSPEIEYYSPQYPDGPIQGDIDYRRTLYWNPEIKVSNGRAEVEFYNNSYTKKLHIRAEGFTHYGEFIVYDSDKKGQ